MGSGSHEGSDARVGACFKGLHDHPEAALTGHSRPLLHQFANPGRSWPHVPRSPKNPLRNQSKARARRSCRRARDAVRRFGQACVGEHTSRDLRDCRGRRSRSCAQASPSKAILFRSTTITNKQQRGRECRSAKSSSVGYRTDVRNDDVHTPAPIVDDGPRHARQAKCSQVSVRCRFVVVRLIGINVYPEAAALDSDVNNSSPDAASRSDSVPNRRW